jgi:hypothetical protein
MTETLTTDTVAQEIPSVSQLLRAIDVSNIRTDAGRNEMRNTIRALRTRAQLDGIDEFDYLKLAILIGFKRRNHQKSQAPGVGAGERDCLRVILHEISLDHPDLVKRVLPLVPIYGCWRDLQVLAEMASPLESGLLTGLPDDIAQIFASQLQKDETVIKSSDKECPSNACKFAPHEFRHHGSRKNRKAEKKSQGRKLQARLGDAIASKIFPSSSTHVRPQYRKLLSTLNSRLTKKGFLIEPLMCANQKFKIQFNRASKGSLSKYKKAIMKDPTASRNWKAAMAKSDSAVPDINDIETIAKEIADCEDVSEILAMMVGKCVGKLRTRRSELSEKATKVLEKLISSTDEGGDEGLRVAIQDLQLGTGVSLFPVVDSTGVSTMKVVALLLCAYIVARAQKLPHFIFDGTLVSLQEESSEESVPPTDAPPVATADDSTPAPSAFARPSESKEEIAHATRFLKRVLDLARNPTTLRNRGDLERITTNVTTLLDSLPVDSTSTTRHTDCLYLTVSSLQELQGDLEQYQVALHNFQHNRSSSSTSLRTLCIHRLIQSHNEEGSIPLVMRPTRQITQRSLVTLDLLLVMDLTGSMGRWMEQAKEHLIAIVNSLKEDTGIGGIRVGFVGYRDYGDAGRTVQHAFVPIERSEAVMGVIRAQQPSGGGDFPEDVLSAFTLARTEFNWTSDLRLMLLVADAPAHGFSTMGDSYPSGRCPDQVPPHLNLKETTRALATETQVDLLLCRLAAQSLDKMEVMFQEVYPQAGFGVLPITSGPDAFRVAILSTISSSILKVLAPENVGGLQTFAGATASALFSTANSSLRESLASIKNTFPLSEEAENEEKEEVGEMDVVGAEGIDLGMGEEGEEDEGAEEKEEGEGEPVKGEEKVTVSGSSSGSGRAVSSSRCRTDYERLMSELNLEELSPVRLALGLPVESSLLDKSAEVLLSAGVTVQDLKEGGYPQGIIDAMTSAGLRLLEKI